MIGSVRTVVGYFDLQRTCTTPMAHAIRILICGDFAVGKSSFIARYIVSLFDAHLNGPLGFF